MTRLLLFYFILFFFWTCLARQEIKQFLKSTKFNINVIRAPFWLYIFPWARVESRVEHARVVDRKQVMVSI